MKFRIALRLFFLLGLLAIIFQIQQGLSPESVRKAFHGLGLEINATKGPSLLPSQGQDLNGQKFNLCPTRIRSIRWADGTQLIEKSSFSSSKWLLTKVSGSAKNSSENEFVEASYLEIEKWLSLHCQITGRPISIDQAGLNMKETEPPHKKIVLEYVDGTAATVQLQRNGAFQVAGKTFFSEELQAGIVALEKIVGYDGDRADAIDRTTN